MALLDQAVAERVSAHRDAILLAAITRVARINLEVDRLILAVRENAPREIRAMVRPEIEAAVEAVAAALDEIARELPPTYESARSGRPRVADARACGDGRSRGARARGKTQVHRLGESRGDRELRVVQ
jgi:metal-dependent HD superfamily phosphatase/phosphodiesterase